MNLRDTIETNEKIIALILKKSEVSEVYELHGVDRLYADQISKENARAQKYLTDAKPS